MQKAVLSQIEFFEELSDSYDQMFSWPTRISIEGTFFKKLVNEYKLKSSLDVACSTGFHVIMLRRMGLDSVGIDASPRMIEKAKNNSITCGVTVEYILGDFTTMSKRFSEGFDLITCLGDTLAHLKSRLEVKKLFQEVYKCLNPGGLFVVQSRNYDHLLKRQARFMPPTGSRNGTEETVFFRVLDFHAKSTDLNVVRFRWHENRWESSVQTTKIYPCLKKAVDADLHSAGFSKLTYYRNFNFEDYDPAGAEFVIVAEKKGVLKSKSAGIIKQRILAAKVALSKAQVVRKHPASNSSNKPQKALRKHAAKPSKTPQKAVRKPNVKNRK